jgi:hypothetical protein
MGLRVIVTDLDRKRLAARPIHNDIVARLGPNVMGYSTVTPYPREAKFPLSTEVSSDVDDRKPIDDPNEAILFTLKENPFSSIRQLSRLTYLSSRPSTVARLNPLG